MRTVEELRVRAKQCLELANRASEFDTKNALKELARELSRQAHQAERGERDRRRVIDSGLHLAGR
jgi:hypothetical protein